MIVSDWSIPAIALSATVWSCSRLVALVRPRSKGEPRPRQGRFAGRARYRCRRRRAHGIMVSISSSMPLTMTANLENGSSTVRPAAARSDRRR